MADKNFMSWDGGGDDPPNTDVLVDPIGAGWKRGSWQDSAKFHKRVGETYQRIRVVDGGTEDAVDANNGCNDNVFSNFSVAAGDVRVLTLKGGSSNNSFSDWRVRTHGPTVDIEIGDWSTYNRSRVFSRWVADDGGAITYAYRFGCKPTFYNMHVKHFWWRSIGLTVYFWGKALWVDVLKQKDTMGK